LLESLVYVACPVLKVTQGSIGISFRAPTAVLEGTSISHFVVQLSGGGCSFDDRVQKVCSWGQGRRGLEAFKQRLAAVGPDGMGVGQPSNKAVEALAALKAKRDHYQKAVVGAEARRKAEKALRAQRERRDRGDFGDPMAGAKKPSGRATEDETGTNESGGGVDGLVAPNEEAASMVVAATAATVGESSKKIPKNVVEVGGTKKKSPVIRPKRVEVDDFFESHVVGNEDLGETECVSST
jgi:hypothetical protein